MPSDEPDVGAAGPRRLAALASGLRRRPLAFLGLFAAIYGFSTTDFADFALLTRDPFVTHPDIGRQFLHSSPLTLFIGWPLTLAFGAETSYAAVCALGFALLAGALRWYLHGRTEDERRTLVTVFLSTPILLVLSRWIGKGDPFVLAFYLALLACRPRVLPSAALATLLVVAHREIGLVILAGDAMLRRRLDIATAVGAAAGVGLVALYHLHLSVPPFSRVDLAQAFLKPGLLGWIRVPVAHLLLAFGWFWLVLFARGWTSDWRRVAVVTAFCFAVSMDGADYTRDFILCASPIVVYVAEAAATTAGLAAVLARPQFPLVFLIQLQLESFDRVSDSQWLGELATAASGLFHHGF